MLLLQRAFLLGYGKPFQGLFLRVQIVLTTLVTSQYSTNGHLACRRAMTMVEFVPDKIIDFMQQAFRWQTKEYPQGGSWNVNS